MAHEPHGKARKTAVQEEREARERIARARESIIRDYRAQKDKSR